MIEMQNTPNNNPRVVSFDFGIKRIGVACGNQITRTTQSIGTIHYQAGKTNWREIKEIIDEWKPSHQVVGLPLHLDGEESTMSRLARKFAHQLEQKTGISVSLTDERLSTHEADHLLNQRLESTNRKPKKNIAQRDSLAAELILQTYFEQLPKTKEQISRKFL